MPSLPETRASLLLRLPDAADARAWDDFAAVYAPLVYRLARRQGLQPADSDDLVQEVLTTVARSVESWLARGDRGPFRAWLLRIARNQAINVLTRHKNKETAGNSAVSHCLNEIPANNDDHSEFDLEHRRQLFQRAEDRVREEVTQRTWQAFWHSTIEDQPIPEVAKRLEMTIGNVYVARSRVMTRLRELVKSQQTNSA
ncbi:MAG TPA: sigma-70 family RNA polymerase sigma factor [Pirellulaceae bacterium]|jgi:RNA polymerase sigma-70 factor (ECF subfamily)